MDHFYQLPGIGTADNPMLEACTTLGALATATTSVQLSTLVTGNTYRNPLLLAKTVTTINMIANGHLPGTVSMAGTALKALVA